jgi:hypothetical protein
MNNEALKVLNEVEEILGELMPVKKIQDLSVMKVIELLVSQNKALKEKLECLQKTS